MIPEFFKGSSSIPRSDKKQRIKTSKVRKISTAKNAKLSKPWKPDDPAAYYFSKVRNF